MRDFIILNIYRTAIIFSYMELYDIYYSPLSITIWYFEHDNQKVYIYKYIYK